MKTPSSLAPALPVPARGRRRQLTERTMNTRSAQRLAPVPARGRRRQLTERTRTRGLLLLALFALGCGGARGLSSAFPDNEPGALAEVIARAGAAAPNERPVAVGLTDRALYAYDLEAGAPLWTQPVEEAKTAPSIAGDLVVLHEGRRVVARRLTDGAVAFSLDDDGLGLVGAAGEGALAAITLSTGGAVGARSRVFLAGGGGVHAELAFDAAVGAPAVRGGVVFLPWGNQNLSAIDGERGEELARLRFLDGVVGHARASGAGVVFGQRGVGRLAPEASPEAVGWYGPDVAALPGRAPLWRDAYEPPAGPESAVHRVSLTWAPAAGEGPLRMTDELVYLTFYRMVFGLGQDGLEARFAYAHPADVVGAAAREGGVLLADAEGGLTFVGADGSPRWSADTGMQPRVVTLRLAGFTPPGSAGSAAPLADQLLAAVENTDTRLVPARAFAAQQLARLPDEGVTAQLIALCEARALPADLRRASCEALGEREVGAEAVLTALARRGSYLEDAAAPPVGPLAQVALRLRDARALPHLLTHLRAPETSLADFPALTAAVAALGDEGAVEALAGLLWLYHAEGEDPGLAAALGHVAGALLALAGAPGVERVEAVRDAAFTSAVVRAQLDAAIAGSVSGSPEASESASEASESAR